ncbi:MAG TPA: hypothetical protein VK824_05725 [Planctomycetota bacterium]|nr:hypothetical protein [Planctomycetota bacterium]
MLHHVSFSAHDPEHVAKGLAGLLDARALAAPCPPFPAGSWFVCEGDAAGTLLEVLPWGHVQERGRSAHGLDASMRERTSTHLLLRTPRSSGEIRSMAAELGWECVDANAGFFQFHKLWVEGAFLVELMTPAQSEGYVLHFGAAGIGSLDGKLRELERALRHEPPAASP